jgi:hypothetical protein
VFGVGLRAATVKKQIKEILHRASDWILSKDVRNRVLGKIFVLEG